MGLEVSDAMTIAPKPLIPTPTLLPGEKLPVDEALSGQKRRSSLLQMGLSEVFSWRAWAHNLPFHSY